MDKGQQVRLIGIMWERALPLLVSLDRSDPLTKSPCILRSHSLTPHDPRYVVLTIEDDEDHAALIHAVFARQDLGATVMAVSSAEEAEEYLLGRWPFSDRVRYPLPDVIVLDLNLPGIGGLGFLQWLSERGGEAEAEGVADIPVVVFTSLRDPDLPRTCFSLGAREFKIKPPEFDGLVEVVHGVIRRWKPEALEG